MPRSSLRRKSFQTVFVETVLFISLFALVGHISLNFWERYVVQKELVQMKTSLYNLKETINHIGVAYTQLYTELKTLADMAESDIRKPKVVLRDKENTPATYKPDVAQALVRDVIDSGLHMRIDKKVKKTQSVASKVTQSNELNALHKEVSQNKSNNFSQPKGDTSPQHKSDPKKDKKDKTNKDIKMTPQSGVARVHLKTIQDKKMMNVETTTRNPSKSRAAGTDEIEDLLEERTSHREDKIKPVQENVHKHNHKEPGNTKERRTIDFEKF